MPEIDWGVFAHEKAREIFDTAKECLMAHSITAVEKYIQRGRVSQASPSYMIRLFIRRNFAAEVQSPAKAFIQEHRADIVVDAGIGREYQRRAVAHELGHIVIAMEKFKGGETLARQSNRLIEDSCKIFEMDLCKRHSNFYAKDEHRIHFLFPSLQEHHVG